MSEQPPAYPFPNDEILYPQRRDWDDFDLETDSYFALGRLPNEQRHTFDGREHRNSLRLVIRTPEKGSMAMLANHADMGTLLALALRGHLETQENVMTEEVEQPVLSLDWLASRIGEESEEIFR